MEFSKGDYVIDLSGDLMVYEVKDEFWYYAQGVSNGTKKELEQLDLGILSTYCYEQSSNELSLYEIKGECFNIKFQLDKVKEIIDNRELDKNSKEFIIFEVNKLVDYISKKIKF